MRLLKKFLLPFFFTNAILHQWGKEHSLCFPQCCNGLFWSHTTPGLGTTVSQFLPQQTERINAVIPWRTVYLMTVFLLISRPSLYKIKINLWEAIYSLYSKGKIIEKSSHKKYFVYFFSNMYLQKLPTNKDMHNIAHGSDRFENLGQL